MTNPDSPTQSPDDFKWVLPYLRMSRSARAVRGMVIGGIVGVEWGFALACYHFLFGNRLMFVTEMIKGWVAWGGLAGLLAGGLGGLLWGRNARALLGMLVLALVGGFIGAFLSQCLVPLLYTIRDGGGDFIEKEWVVAGVIVGGVVGVCDLLFPE